MTHFDATEATLALCRFPSTGVFPALRDWWAVDELDLHALLSTVQLGLEVLSTIGDKKRVRRLRAERLRLMARLGEAPSDRGQLAQDEFDFLVWVAWWERAKIGPTEPPPPAWPSGDRRWRSDRRVATQLTEKDQSVSVGSRDRLVQGDYLRVQVALRQAETLMKKGEALEALTILQLLADEACSLRLGLLAHATERPPQLPQRARYYLYRGQLQLARLSPSCPGVELLQARLECVRGALGERA